MYISISPFRERQDSDGQMKELQDQLEAEQYFSVCAVVAIFPVFLNCNADMFWFPKGLIVNFISLLPWELIEYSHLQPR